MKQLEESKTKAKDAVVAFEVKARTSVEETAKSVTSHFEKRLNEATKAISDKLRAVQESQELNHLLKDKSLNTLQKYFVSYCISDNSEFVFGFLRSYLVDLIGCATSGQLPSPVLRSEAGDVLKYAKRSVAADRGLYGSLDTSGVMTSERLLSIMNRALATLCEEFDKITREIDEITANARQRISELGECLLEEIEKEYNKLCEQVLAIEEGEEERHEGVALQFGCPEKLYDISRELEDESFCEFFFNKIFIIPLI